MRIQRDPSENGTHALEILTTMLGVKITRTTIDKVKLHPDYPSLLSLSDSLFAWGINNIAIKLDIDKLSTITLPIIAHIKKNGGHFVVLSKLENDLLHYTDPEVGTVQESLNDFKKKWTGVILLPEATIKSGEKNYEKKRQREIFQRTSRNLVLLLLAAFVIVPNFYLSVYTSLLYGLKAVGSFISLLLLQKQFGISGARVDSICKMGSKSDCDSVIKSPASSLGIFYLSEIGAWYFIGGLLSVLLSAYSTISVNGLLFLFTTVALPFSFFAVYYQGMVIKKWCPLCLVVMADIWIEFSLHLLFGSRLSIEFPELPVVFVGFSLPLIFWLSVRQPFTDSFKLFSRERSLNRFLKNENVFRALLEKQTTIDHVPFTLELNSGSAEAPLQIIMVSNPFCGPCEKTHTIIEDLIGVHGHKVNVSYRFVVNDSDRKSPAYQMLSTLFSAYVNGSKAKALQALSAWYRYGKKNIDTWKRDYSVEQSENHSLIETLIKQHSNWCVLTKIDKTPTIFIDGRELPEQFPVRELSYHARKLIERNSVPELVVEG